MATMNLEEAAHIYAASPGGPRYNPELSDDACRSIENGIWLCRKHARVIDVGHKVYAAQTLKTWKKSAELRARYVLLGGDTDQAALPSVLLRLGHRLVCWVRWLAIEHLQWTFEVVAFVEGSIQDLQMYCSSFSQMPSYNRFVIIESQGDGRCLEGIHLKVEQGQRVLLECFVGPKAPRSIHQDMADFALDSDFDLETYQGDLHVVTGTEAAIQAITLSLSLQYGDLKEFPDEGSEFRWILAHYQHDPLLNKMIKMEVARLLTVGANLANRPGLDFVNRVIDVQVLGVRQLPICSPAIVHLELEFGDGEQWKGIIQIPV